MIPCVAVAVGIDAFASRHAVLASVVVAIAVTVVTAVLVVVGRVGMGMRMMMRGKLSRNALMMLMDGQVVGPTPNTLSRLEPECVFRQGKYA